MTQTIDLRDHDEDCGCDSCRIKRIEDDMAQIKAMVTKVIGEVKPTLDELMNSSVFKMLGLKAKK